MSTGSSCNEKPIKKLHRWDVSYARARDLQRSLARRVRVVPLKASPRAVAGIDCAFSKDGRRIVAAVVVLNLPDLEPIETTLASRKAGFPYIPGLLSFREAPACIAAVEKLQNHPDVFIIDGQGIAHPRRLGLAAHLGLFFDRPTIGCAKSRLCGQFQEPGAHKGAYTLLSDDKGRTLGAVLRTRANVKPVFVSVGHRCTLQDAIRITLACTSKYRLPEPTRLAHQFVSNSKLKL